MEREEKVSAIFSPGGDIPRKAISPRALSSRGCAEFAADAPAHACRCYFGGVGNDADSAISGLGNRIMG